jgi:hypothetical protein
MDARSDEDFAIQAACGNHEQLAVICIMGSADAFAVSGRRQIELPDFIVSRNRL